MNGKERVKTALKHQEPDRVPISCQYTPEIQQLLEDYTGQKGLDVNVAMGDDAVIVWEGMANLFNGKINEGETYDTEWGIRFLKKGLYNEICHNPLSIATTVDELKKYPFPLPVTQELIDRAANIIKKYSDNYAIIGAVPLTMWEGAIHLRGYQQMLEDMLTNLRMAETLLDRVMEYHFEIAMALIDLGIDILWLGDDVGMQSGMLISPNLWRQVFKPRWKMMFQAFKKRNPNLIIAYHSDGGIRPIIPDFIEIGLDLLNPLQPLSIGMDSFELKKDFGKDLSFFGGIDIQEALPFGTPRMVRDEVKKRIDAFAPGGGYLCGPTHNIQADTSLENILTMYQTIQNYGQYTGRY
jgi:uroporphyrinogen decarboxylase